MQSQQNITFEQQWQQTMGIELLMPADKRKVLYISDKAGSRGKTTFVEQMALKYPNRVHVVPIAASNCGLMSLNMTNIERRKEKDIIIVGVNRQ